MSKTNYYLPFGPEIKLGQPYGARAGLFPNPPGGHNGDDWLTPIGTPVRAAGHGVVIWAGTFDTTYADNFGWNLNYGGNMVVLNMDGDTEPYFEYGHLSDIHVKVGDRVVPAQIIALSGNSDGGTGVSTGAHCHVGCLPYNFNLGSNTYGRENPRHYMTRHWDGSVQVQAAPIKPPEEEDEMYVIARDSAAADPNATWIGNGVHRRHIPDPPTLAAMQKMAGWGCLKLYKNGDVQNLPTEALGELLTETVPSSLLNAKIPRQGAGTSIGPSTTPGAVFSWFDANVLGLLEAIQKTASQNGVSVDEITEALKKSLSSGIEIDVVASLKK